MQSQKFIKDEETNLEVVDTGVKRKILGYNGNLMMVKIYFDLGAIGAKHSHSHSQTSYIEKGKFEVTIDYETNTLTGGDAFYVPPDIVHGVKALEPGVLIDVFNPIREDFLK